jgi:tetratricopeptide (TPR) repeat protein
VNRRLLFPFICVLLVAGSRGSRAADGAGAQGADRAEGRRRFDKGEQHFRRGEYQAALEDYEAGYRLTRLPGFLINIAHCYRLGGDPRKARATYRKYLVIEPASPHKAEIEELIRALDKVVAADDGGVARATSAKPRTPSVRWWLWSALAASVVGSTVANIALAEAERRQ